MTWRRLLEILILFSLIVITAVVNPVSVLILICFKAGLSFFATFVVISAWTSLTLVLTYYEIGRLKNWPVMRVIWGGLQSWYAQNGFGRELGRQNANHQKRLVDHLLHQRKQNWLVIVLGFVPFVPYLPTVTIIATRLSNIKYGVIFLLLGNVFRLWFFSGQIYHGLTKLFS